MPTNAKLIFSRLDSTSSTSSNTMTKSQIRNDSTRTSSSSSLSSDDSMSSIGPSSRRSTRSILQDEDGHDISTARKLRRMKRRLLLEHVASAAAASLDGDSRPTVITDYGGGGPAPTTLTAYSSDCLSRLHCHDVTRQVR